MGNATRVARNSVLSFSMSVSLKAANVIVFILISRIGNVEQAGVFSLATIYLLVLSAIMIGLDELVTREVARDARQAKAYYSVYSLARVCLSLGFYLVLVVVTDLLQYPDTTRWVILTIGLCLFPDGITGVGQALLGAYEHFGTPFIAGILSGIVKIAGSYVALDSGYGLLGISVVWLCGSLINALIVTIAAVRHAGGFTLSKQYLLLLSNREFRLSTPFFLIGLLSTLEYQADVFIISKALGELALGLYSSVTTITASMALLSQAYRAAVYPVMIRQYQDDIAALARIYRFSIISLGTLAFPVVAGLFVLAPQVLVWIYSPRFEGAGLPLQISVFVLLFWFLGVPSSRVLLIFEKQRLIPWMWLVSLAVNITLNLVLIPRFNIQGAAVARVVSEFIFFLWGFLVASRLIRYTTLLRDLMLPAVAACIMGAVVWLLRDQPLWIPVLAGVIIYPFVLWGGVRLIPTERWLFTEIWKVMKQSLPYKGN